MVGDIHFLELVKDHVNEYSSTNDHKTFILEEKIGIGVSFYVFPIKCVAKPYNLKPIGISF